MTKLELRDYQKIHNQLPKTKAKKKQWNLNNQMKTLKYELTRNYGPIAFDYYLQQYLVQKGRCAICGDWHPHCAKGRLILDHRHSDMRVRGLLCRNCNSAIGLLKESPELLDKAKKYLGY